MIPIISYFAVVAAMTIFLVFAVRGRIRKAKQQRDLDSRLLEMLAAASTSMDSFSGVPSSHVLSYTSPTPCEVCFSSSVTRCAKCKISRYCSGKCQIIHWRQGHKEECRLQQHNDTGSSSEQKSDTSVVEGGHSTANPAGNEQMSHNLEPFGEAVSVEDDDGNSSETVTLSDLDVLVCPICFENLSIPVYQCKNGHILCSVCSASVKDFCPTCKLQSEHYRCRGIEKILESAKAACPNKKYGCTMIVPWIDRSAHEAVCLFPPCCCPFTNCGFVGTPSQLSAHVRREHDNVIRFLHGQNFRVILSNGMEFQVLLEEKKGTVFVLQNQRQVDGNAFSICVIRHKNMGQRFFYKLTVKHWERTQSIKAPAEIVQSFRVDHVPIHHLFVPGSYFSSLDEIELKINIRVKGEDQ